MPNWVQHDLLITGPRDELRRFVAECFSERDPEGNGEGPYFDFEKIVPKPEGFDAELSSPAKADDPRAIANVELTGCPTWYEWNNANWGTKWNACHCEVEWLDFENQLSLKFDTAWDTPRPIWKLLRQRYPLLRISGTIDEEGGFFYMILNEGVTEQFEGIRPGGPYDYGDEDEKGEADGDS